VIDTASSQAEGLRNRRRMESGFQIEHSKFKIL
jgi:hypothetical protein